MSLWDTYIGYIPDTLGLVDDGSVARKLFTDCYK